MKELLQIIENLHNINQQVIEKDNYISNYTDLIELFSQLVHDPDFVKSEIYLDLKLKYITPIETKLNSVQNLQKITIQPEMVTTSAPGTQSTTKKPSKKFTSSQVTGPIPTDIFCAPRCRKLPAGKKKVIVSIRLPGLLTYQQRRSPGY